MGVASLEQLFHEGLSVELRTVSDVDACLEKLCYESDAATQMLADEVVRLRVSMRFVPHGELARSGRTDLRITFAITKQHNRMGRVRRAAVVLLL